MIKTIYFYRTTLRWQSNLKKQKDEMNINEYWKWFLINIQNIRSLSHNDIIIELENYLHEAIFQWISFLLNKKIWTKETKVNHRILIYLSWSFISHISLIIDRKSSLKRTAISRTIVSGTIEYKLKLWYFSIIIVRPTFELVIVFSRMMWCWFRVKYPIWEISIYCLIMCIYRENM